MEKIEKLQKILKNIGIETTLYPVRDVVTFDGKLHRGIELVLQGVYDEEFEPYTFIFTPNGEYVDTWLDCPLVERKPQPQVKK